MDGRLFDLLIIGGGINGVGVAADAAGRGLSVCLVDMGDLASGTSQASSKLIHGGLRYLEHFEFRLVREALAEREVLLKRAPHVVWPLRFILPLAPGQRSALKLRAGLFLYDQLAHRRILPRSKTISLSGNDADGVLKGGFKKGFAYWDCWVDDSRLVVLNARLAERKGATIATRTRVTDLTRGAGAWTVGLDSAGDRSTCAARVIVNAAGPWADTVAALARKNEPRSRPNLRLVKGSHIVVPRIAGAECAFLIQNGDGRIVFLLPFEEQFTLIGTTETPFSGSPSDARCSPDEEAYLIDAANNYLDRALHRQDIVWSFAGVRPLAGHEEEQNPSEISRDYRIELTGSCHGDALLTILGGKVTTYRRLAEGVMHQVDGLFPGLPGPWTANSVLPGGDLPDGDVELFTQGLARLYAWLPENLLTALVRRHGTLARDVIGDARRIEDMGQQFPAGLTGREVAYMATNEWAATPDDVLWRRTKSGLHYRSAPDREVAAKAIAALL